MGRVRGLLAYDLDVLQLVDELIELCWYYDLVQLAGLKGLEGQIFDAKACGHV